MKPPYTIPLFLFPLFLLWAKGPTLEKLFNESRPIHQAQRLEDIYGNVAGNRVDVTPVTTISVYLVQPGDSWERIAKAHQIPNAEALAQHNRNRALKPGMSVEIPSNLVEKP